MDLKKTHKGKQENKMDKINKNVQKKKGKKYRTKERKTGEQIANAIQLSTEVAISLSLSFSLSLYIYIYIHVY